MNHAVLFASEPDMAMYENARVEAHNAVQWLARMSRSYCEGADRASAPVLYWDQQRSAICTPEVRKDVGIELIFPDLALQFTENGESSPHALDLEGKSSTEVEAWLLIELLHRGIGRSAFAKSLPYKIEPMMDGDEIKYSPEAFSGGLIALTQFLRSGALVLNNVRQTLVREMSGRGLAEIDPGPDRSRLIVWPDRFETGFVLRSLDGAAENHAIRVGLSLSDQKAAAPSLFVRYVGAQSQAAPLIDRSLPLGHAIRQKLSFDSVAAGLMTVVRNAFDVEKMSATA
jgi:hypothetical protein